MLLLRVGWIFVSGSGGVWRKLDLHRKVSLDLYLCFLFGLEVLLFLFLFLFLNFFSVLYEYLDLWTEFFWEFEKIFGVLS